MAIGTLIVVAWAEHRYGLAVATTMGLITISLLHIVAALEWRDPLRSVFHRGTRSPTAASTCWCSTALVLTFLVTTIDGLQRIFDTVELDRRPVAGLLHRRARLLRAGRDRQADHAPRRQERRDLTAVAEAPIAG